MRYVILGIILGILLVASIAQASCRTLVMPDGTVILVCCDSHGNCTYN